MLSIDSQTLFDDVVRHLDAQKHTPLSLALFDLDSFGQLNEAEGAEVGDVVLDHLGRLFSESTGESEKVYRYGGDAFMLLYPGLEKEQAFLRAEHLRSEIDREWSVPVNGKDRTLRITVSCGVAGHPDDATAADDLVRKCREALYRAKVTGRNKVSLAREEKMVTKTVHYRQGQLEGLSRLAKREGLNEATMLREALDDLLRKYNA